MFYQKKLRGIFLEQEEKIKKMKTAMNACQPEIDMIDFLETLNEGSEQIDSVIKNGETNFIITIHISYNSKGFTEDVNFYGYIQNENGKFVKSNILHSHLFYHEEYCFAEYTELCNHIETPQNNVYNDFIMKAFLKYIHRMKIPKIETILSKNSHEWTQQKSFYEKYGFHLAGGYKMYLHMKN